MKIIIAGSRTLQIFEEGIYSLLCAHKIHRNQYTEVVSGGAGGIDKCGEFFATYYNVDLKRFPADWDTHGKAAGVIRNKQMAEYADALLLIWDGKSRGSANMKKEMEKLGKPIYEVIIK